MTKRFFPWLGFFLLLTVQACAAGTDDSSNPAAAASETALWSSPSTATPSATSTATEPLRLSPVATPTRLASLTPEGNDLELLDVTLATEYDGASLLGWIRNNTDRIAFLGGAELGLQMRIVEWTMDGFNRYTRKVMDNIVPEYRPYTTCAIFPGETGIVALSLRCAEKDGCTIAEETSANPPPELGTVLEYSSRLQPIPEDWDTADRHPAAEAYGLLRKEDFLFFRFAMASINEDYSYLRYRIVLLDAEGTLLNVASDDKYLHSPYAPATTTTIGWIGKNNYFLAPQVVGSRVESFLPTTREMLDRVDHTEVFLEYSDGCIS